MSDKPPFTQETESFYEGGPDPKQCFDQCRKNHGHTNFIPVKDFQKEDLPPAFQTDEIMGDIEQYCQRTVKVTVKYTSPNRPDYYPNTLAPYPYSNFTGSEAITRCGTGYIRYTLPSAVVKDKPCPCHLCIKSGIPKERFLFVTVTTAAHVIFDDYEAERTECEMFYDSEDKKGVKIFYGVKKSVLGESGLFDSDAEMDRARLIEKCNEDRSVVTCVTHDPELIEILPSMHGKFDFEKLPVPLIASHPHGFIKHISIGSIVSCIVPVPSDRPIDDIYTIAPGSKCRMTKDFNPALSSNEFFQIVDNGHFHEKEGVEYTLKEGIILSLPPGARYLCQYVIPAKKYNDHPHCSMYLKRFPPGTRFTYKNIQDSFLLPDIEFYEENGKKIEFPKGLSYFLTYSIPTCQGCSGAPVRADIDRFPLYWDSHAGAFEDGTNRSGIHTPNHVNY